MLALLALQVTHSRTTEVFVCPVIEASAQRTTWQPPAGAAPVLAMVDSGSAVTTCPVDHAPDFPIEATMALPMNAAGEGQTLVHHGRKMVRYVTRSGYSVVMKYEVTSVRFPILSVKRITKGGASAHFGDSGAWMDFPGYGSEQLLDLQDTYWLELWIDYGLEKPLMVCSNSSSSKDAAPVEVADEVEVAEAQQDSVKTKMRRLPATPSLSEIAEHAASHLPFRDWCKHCISGKQRTGRTCR